MYLKTSTQLMETVGLYQYTLKTTISPPELYILASLYNCSTALLYSRIYNKYLAQISFKVDF